MIDDGILLYAVMFMYSLKSTIRSSKTTRKKIRLISIKVELSKNNYTKIKKDEI